MLAAYLASAGRDELGNLPRQVAASISTGVSEEGANALCAYLPSCTSARLVLPVSRRTVVVTAGLLAPGPALFSLWERDQDTDMLGLSTVTARRGFPSSLGGPFTEAVFADGRCNFAVFLPTAAEVPGAEDFSLGFVGWLLLGFVDEAAWEARRAHAVRLASKLSCMLAVCAPALLANLRTYFLDATVLSARPALLEASAAAAARARAVCRRRRRAAGDRSSSEDSAGGLRLDIEDEPGTPPPVMPGRQLLSLAQAGRCDSAADSAAGVSDAGPTSGPLAAEPASALLGEAPGGSVAGGAEREEGGKVAKGSCGALRTGQHWLWLTFRDRAVEARFRAFHAAQLAKHDTLSFWLCMVLMLVTAKIYAATAPMGAMALMCLFPLYPAVLTFMRLNNKRYKRWREVIMLTLRLFSVVVGDLYAGYHIRKYGVNPHQFSRPVGFFRACGMESIITLPVFFNVRFARALPAQTLSSATLIAAVIPWVCQAVQPGVPSLAACVAKGSAMQAVMGMALPMALLYTHEAHSRRSFLAALQRA
ncbi:hypothetical protein WJX81_008699 [Elliptochloris bilobata]|uniref:Uncharacterized protein n=1 Tax=Elliptochloris bilobata TaxID=381761 RepID=A0AAW1S0F4_9CHLO